MVNVLWFFPYVIAGGVMWLLAYQLAPIGREIPLSRAILTVILLGVCGVLSGKFLGPLIGKGWLIPVDFVVSTLVVKALLDLTFRRSLVAVLIYWLVWFVAIAVVSHFGKAPAPNAALAPFMVASLTLGRSVIPSRS
jgi:hypothetical protein